MRTATKRFTRTKLLQETVSMDRSSRSMPYINLQFCKAVENHTPFHSLRFNFRGYDGSLWVEPHDNDDSYYRAGDLSAGFSKEFRNSLNGYYYLLINERTFIGYDVD